MSLVAPIHRVLRTSWTPVEKKEMRHQSRAEINDAVWTELMYASLYVPCVTPALTMFFTTSIFVFSIAFFRSNGFLSVSFEKKSLVEQKNTMTMNKEVK